LSQRCSEKLGIQDSDFGRLLNALGQHKCGDPIALADDVRSNQSNAAEKFVAVLPRSI
jgi:hypothetical protein